MGFNKTSIGAYDAFAEFVSMHYTLSQRNDTQYWLDARERLGGRSKEIGIYKSYGIDNAIFKRDFSSAFDGTMGGLPMIATGLNYFPVDLNTIRRTEFKHGINLSFVNDSFEIWESNKVYWKSVADKSPTILEYLESKYDNSK
jgi:hypothetical protein